MDTKARVAELVDAADSKSAAFAGVPVQVRPLQPSTFPIELDSKAHVKSARLFH